MVVREYCKMFASGLAREDDACKTKNFAFVLTFHLPMLVQTLSGHFIYFCKIRDFCVSAFVYLCDFAIFFSNSHAHVSANIFRWWTHFDCLVHHSVSLLPSPRTMETPVVVYMKRNLLPFFSSHCGITSIMVEPMQ